MTESLKKLTNEDKEFLRLASECWNRTNKLTNQGTSQVKTKLYTWQSISANVARTCYRPN